MAVRRAALREGLPGEADRERKTGKERQEFRHFDLPKFLVYFLAKFQVNCSNRDFEYNENRSIKKPA
jgi:hypothetical protein